MLLPVRVVDEFVHPFSDWEWRRSFHCIVNSRQLVIPLESLLYLAIIADGGNRDSIIDKLNVAWNDSAELSEQITLDKHWKKKRFLKTCGNVSAVISVASAVLSTGQGILQAVIPMISR